MADGLGLIAGINDGTDRRYQQRTPRKRILAALFDIRRHGHLKPREVPQMYETYTAAVVLPGIASTIQMVEPTNVQIKEGMIV